MTSSISEAVLFLSRSLAVSILFKASIMLALGLIAASLAGRSRAALCSRLPSLLLRSAACLSCRLLRPVAANFSLRFQYQALASRQPLAWPCRRGPAHLHSRPVTRVRPEARQWGLTFRHGNSLVVSSGWPEQ